MTRKILRGKLPRMCLIGLISAILAGCEVPAPGTPLPTVTPFPTNTLTRAPAPTATVTEVPPTVPEPTSSPTEAPTDTPTLAPTSTVLVPEDTATPTPTPTETPLSAQLWPTRPAEFSDYVNAIVAYVNASPIHIVRLRAMLRDWGAITDRLGSVQEADVDNDGQLEWVIAVINPLAQTLVIPSELFVMDRQDGDYVVLYQPALETGVFLDNAAILATEDINADGRIDLGYTTTSCGAHTCFVSVTLLTWDGAAFQSLTDGTIEMPYAEVRLENHDSDPALELLLHGGMIGSVGAGPQRARLEVYDWDGTYYVLSSTTYDESDFLYFRVIDANAALLAGDLTRAVALYQDAISNTDLRTWHDSGEAGQQERDDLTAFSRYRLTLTYLLMHDQASAEATAEELQAEQPDHIYNQVTQILLDYYGKQGTVTGACQAVTEFATENPQTAEMLSDFGYANPTFTVDDVCPSALGAWEQ